MNTSRILPHHAHGVQIPLLFIPPMMKDEYQMNFQQNCNSINENLRKNGYAQCLQIYIFTEALLNKKEELPEDQMKIFNKQPVDFFSISDFVYYNNRLEQLFIIIIDYNSIEIVTPKMIQRRKRQCKEQIEWYFQIEQQKNLM